MRGLLVQFLGLFALLGLAAWGYRHWISPHQVGIQGRGMLLLSVVTLVGGLLGSTGWWIDDPRSFSWDLPPLASRMLASAGWALVMLLTIAVGAVYALRYADVSRVMLGVIGVYGFGIMLANLWNIFANKPVNPTYVAAFGIIFLVSAALLLVEK
jgi:hypothetical protein